MNCDGCFLAVVCGGEPEEFVKGLYVKYTELLAELMVMAGGFSDMVLFVFLVGYAVRTFEEEEVSGLDMAVWGECFDAKDVEGM